MFRIQEVVIPRRSRRGSLDAVAVTPAPKDSLAPTGLPPPRQAQGDFVLSTGQAHPYPVCRGGTIRMDARDGTGWKIGNRSVFGNDPVAVICLLLSVALPPSGRHRYPPGLEIAIARRISQTLSILCIHANSPVSTNWVRVSGAGCCCARNDTFAATRNSYTEFAESRIIRQMPSSV